MTEIDAAHIIAEERIPLLRCLAIFDLFPAQLLLRLAGQLVPSTVPAGTTIIREGDGGDRFYIIGAGEVSVSVGDHVVRTLRAPDFFGEIALLRDIPRTATVTSETPVFLYALGRQDFLEAMTGHALSMETADEISRARLEDHAEE